MKDTTGGVSHDAARPRGGGVLLRVQLPAGVLRERGMRARQAGEGNGGRLHLGRGWGQG